MTAEVTLLLPCSCYQLIATLFGASPLDLSLRRVWRESRPADRADLRNWVFLKVMRRMLFCRHNLKILDSVITLVMVDMMDDLS